MCYMRLGLVVWLGMGGGVQGATGAAEGMLFEEHVVNGIYNVGDALWGVCGAVVLLAIVVLVVGLKVAGAIGKK